MTETRRVTVELPRNLLERARRTTGEGITATIRRGLELLAARQSYRQLRKLRGKVRLSVDVDALRLGRSKAKPSRREVRSAIEEGRVVGHRLWRRGQMTRNPRCACRPSAYRVRATPRPDRAAHEAHERSEHQRASWPCNR